MNVSENKQNSALGLRELNESTIDQLPTQVDLKALHSWDDQDAWAIDKMTTWILPAISVPSVTGAITTSQKALVSNGERPVALLRNLMKSSGIYAIASVALPLVSLVLTPFLTNYLSPADYGILTILTTLISLGAGITQLGLTSAFFRAYTYDYTSRQERSVVLSTVTILLCFISVTTAIVVIIMAPFLANLLFGRPALGSLVALAAGVLLVQNLTVPGFAWLRAENHPLVYSLLSVCNLLITLFTTIFLVAGLHLGIAGSLIATGSGYMCVMVCTIPFIIRRAGISIRIDIARSMLAFGLPLVLSFLSYWVLQLSDRYLLSLFGSLEQTAKYAVVYTLGSAMAVVVLGPFTLAWPTAVFAIAKRTDAALLFRLVFRWFGLSLLFAAFSLSLAGTFLLDQLFTVAYHSVALIIPIVAVSNTFYGIYYVFTVGANVKRKTWLVGLFTALAALINVILNLFLIPHYQAMGAAFSTLLAYIALAAVAYIVNQRLYPIRFEIGVFVTALLVGITLYIASDFLAKGQQAFAAWGIRLCILGLYGGCLALLGKLLARREDSARVALTQPLMGNWFRRPS